MEISLAISDANEVVSIPIQAENKNKYMDVVFYNAAVKGEIDVVEEQADNLARLLTPRNNTILHINILARPKEMDSIEFLRGVLDKCPPLLFHANDKGETPLHIAARFGHHQVVKVLLEHAKSPRNIELESGTRQILQMTSKQKDTALHEAVRMNHTQVVRLLIKEDPDFSYSANKTGETPLYLAVERSYNHLAFEILDFCTSLVHRGPNGRTTLHAAVIKQDQEMTRRILERTKSTLTSEVDDEGGHPFTIVQALEDAL
nr:ankyrin repeat-containing protein At5g02620-like [Ziziphus jujuba var. spinosa]